MADRESLNPYAPTISPTASVRAAAAAQRDGIVPFDGVIDVDIVTKTDYISLGCGLIFGLGFAAITGLSAMEALLLAARPQTFAASMLLGASVLTMLALVAFVFGQRVKPLKGYRWMSGTVRGVLYADQIDIEWDAGEASLMLAKPALNIDWVNRQGRLFVICGVPCFIPAASVAAEHWHHMRRGRLPGKLLSPGRPERKEPPPPLQDALVFHSTFEEFARDVADHRFVSTAPQASRNFTRVFLGLSLLAALNGEFLRVEWIVMLTVLASAAICSGLCWLLREGVRRHWPIRFRRLGYGSRSSSIVVSAPSIVRWMTNDELLAGVRGGWIRLPWSAVCKAVITQHAVELWFGPDNHTGWMFERGDRTDPQWMEVIDLVRCHVTSVRLWGSVRDS